MCIKWQMTCDHRRETEKVSNLSVLWLSNLSVLWQDHCHIHLSDCVTCLLKCHQCLLLLPTHFKLLIHSLFIFSCAPSAYLAVHCHHTLINVVPCSCGTLSLAHYTQPSFSWLIKEIQSLILTGKPIHCLWKYNILTSFFLIPSSHSWGSLFKLLWEHHSI